MHRPNRLPRLSAFVTLCVGACALLLALTMASAVSGEARNQPSGEQTLTIAGSDLPPDTLDPALIRDASSSFIARQLFRGLVQLDETLEIQPALAESVAVSDDGLRYTFVLRPGVAFQDGTPIDAAAVKASFERATDPALAGGDGFALPAAIYLNDIAGAERRLAGETDTIDGIRVVDERTVEMTLVAPAASFLNKLTGGPAQIVDAGSAGGDGWWQDPNGSGPFRLAEFGDDEIVLESVDDWWAGAPALEEVHILLGAAAAEPLNLYEAGEIDITDVPFYALDRVLSEADPLHDELIVVPQLSTSFVLLNPNLAPFDDPAARRAVAQAFDREKVARVMLDDKVRLADGIVPPGILGRDWPAEPIALDVAAARAWVEQRGAPTTEPAFFDGGVAVAFKLVLERELGIAVEAISLDWDAFSDRLVDGTMPAFSLSWIADYPDPSNFLTTMFHSRSPDNYIGYANPGVDALLDAAEREADPDARAQNFLDAQQLVIDDAVLIPLYHDVAYTVVKPHVKGVTVSPVGILGLEGIWIERDE